jgi:uncharacterized protein (TIGR03032 family)
MGLWASAERLVMATRYQLWQLDNVLAPGMQHRGHDRLYVPRRSTTTGEVDAHDVAVDRRGRLLFVNTQYSCLATVSERHSFEPLWRPPFVTALAPEDRCHLNGLALDGGEPRFLTACSPSDRPHGWRERRGDGGCLIDFESGEPVISGLSMPHSPRVYGGKVWVLNSGKGEIGTVDVAAGRFEPVAFGPGYLRGLAFFARMALVGLSKPRERVFSGLALDDRLARRGAAAECGLLAIDVETGAVVHWLRFGSPIVEIYDVQLLPGVRRPMALGFRGDEVRRVITFLEGTRTALHTLETIESLSEESVALARGAGAVPEPRKEQRDDLRLLSLEAPLAQFSARAPRLLHGIVPRIATARAVRDPLIAALALRDGRAVGLALAERRDEGAAADVLSLVVAPEERGRGLGARLLGELERACAARGVRALGAGYRSSWKAAAIVGRMLRRAGWSEPTIKRRIAKADIGILSAPWLRRWLDTARPRAGEEVFAWRDLSAAERAEIVARQRTESWFPAALAPFQIEHRIEETTSVGLRRRGRVAGWLITHRTAADTIQYTSLFVEPALQKLGHAVPLIAEAVRRHLAAEIPYGIFMVDVENTAMMRFVERRLAPFLASTTDLLWSERWLGARAPSAQAPQTEEGEE